MGATAVLAEESVTVDPGGEARSEVRVRNTGSVVDQYNFEILGETAPWVHVEPPTLSLFPGDEGVAHLEFRPPRDSSVPHGPLPFGLRVTSKEDPSESAIEEGTVVVGRFVETFAEVIPRTSRGSRRARHELAIDNRGNTRVNAEVTANDPDDLLRFVISPPTVVAEPGAAAFAKVTVIPRKRFLRGPDRTIPFRVLADTGTPPPLTAEGSMLQEAIVPSWVPKALVGLAALALVLGMAWLTLLRPSIKSAAKEAVQEDAKEAGTQAALAELLAAGIQPRGGPAAPPATPPAAPPANGGGSTQSSTTTPGPTPAAAAGSFVDGRLAAGGKTVYEVPKDKVLHVTDIVLQNPSGNSGTIQVQRSGSALLVVNLDNFRDLDYHFVAPLVFKADEKFELKAECKGPCTPALYWAGFLRPA